MKPKTKRKKTPEIDKDRFVESVYHIVFYGNTARSFNSVLLSVADKINENERMVIRYSIQWNVMLMTNSLMDEFEKYFLPYKSSSKETKNRIDSFEYIIEPILAQIKKWCDLRKFRNNVLAHNFRVDADGFKSVHLNNKLKSYNIPESTMDLITLLKLLDSITRIVEEMFKEEYNEALAIVDSFGNTPKRIMQSIEEEAKNTNLILLETNKRIAEYNIKLKGEAN